ncbi:MAG: flagellar hook basal-body protein [Myxococcales bacterium]|nr:flagellar hook basal-body protein [Myxococcales bacterium]
MANGIYVAAAGAIARRNQLNITANNLANTTTTGFRAQRVTFQEVLSDEAAPNRHLVSVGQSIVSQERGPIERTGRTLDLSIVDEGFFIASDISGQTLLKSVSAQVDADGTLRDSAGRSLGSLRGELRLDPRKPVYIGEHGEVKQEGKEIDRLSIVSVSDPRALQPLGNGAYQQTQLSGNAYPIHGRVEAGTLEKSNVNAVTSMVNLINLERDFQALTRVIHAYREADDGIINSSSLR